MTKKLIRETISLLNTLKKDAKMALNGDWDCTTDEGKEGFECQIQLIDDLLSKLRKELK